MLADHVTPDDPIRYADAVVVAPDGTIYFTDASTRFSPAQWGGTFGASLLDIMEHSATGRVLAYDPATGKTRIVAHGLSFANGIALSSDGHTLFVNETGRYRIWKIDGRANGPRRAQRLAAGHGAARQPAGLSRQPDARTRRPHLGRALPCRAIRRRMASPRSRSCAR